MTITEDYGPVNTEKTMSVTAAIGPNFKRQSFRMTNPINI